MADDTYLDDLDRVLEEAEQIKADRDSEWYGGLARQFGQGVTFGYADEIEARLRAIGDSTYEDEVADIRSSNKKFADENFLASMLAQGAGGALTWAVPGAGLARVARGLGRLGTARFLSPQGLRTATTPGQLAWQGAKQGAIGGATYGLGTAESNNPGELGLHATFGGALGAGVGAVATPIAAGIFGGGKNALRATADPADEAMRSLRRSVEKTGMTVDEALEMVRPTLRGRGGAASRLNQETQDALIARWIASEDPTAEIAQVAQDLSIGEGTVRQHFNAMTEGMQGRTLKDFVRENATVDVTQSAERMFRAEVREYGAARVARAMQYVVDGERNAAELGRRLGISGDRAQTLMARIDDQFESVFSVVNRAREARARPLLEEEGAALHYSDTAGARAADARYGERQGGQYGRVVDAIREGTGAQGEGVSMRMAADRMDLRQGLGRFYEHFNGQSDATIAQAGRPPNGYATSQAEELALLRGGANGDTFSQVETMVRENLFRRAVNEGASHDEAARRFLDPENFPFEVINEIQKRLGQRARDFYRSTTPDTLQGESMSTLQQRFLALFDEFYPETPEVRNEAGRLVSERIPAFRELRESYGRALSENEAFVTGAGGRMRGRGARAQEMAEFRARMDSPTPPSAEEIAAFRRGIGEDLIERAALGADSGNAAKKVATRVDRGMADELLDPEAARTMSRRLSNESRRQGAVDEMIGNSQTLPRFARMTQRELEAERKNLIQIVTEPLGVASRWFTEQLMRGRFDVAADVLSQTDERVLAGMLTRLQRVARQQGMEDEVVTALAQAVSTALRNKGVEKTTKTFKEPSRGAQYGR